VSQITGRSADQSRDIITNMNASGRLVDPQAIGNVIAMLCLPLSRDINGAAMTLDGGTSA
jgi:NAD(P)-dependent dehydrogenase (short-subunit alcohol dehydrogenase family)